MFTKVLKALKLTAVELLRPCRAIISDFPSNQISDEEVKLPLKVMSYMQQLILRKIMSSQFSEEGKKDIKIVLAGVAVCFVFRRSCCDPIDDIFAIQP